MDVAGIDFAVAVVGVVAGKNIQRKKERIGQIGRQSSWACKPPADIDCP